jgi:general secretion pathway protein J
MTRGRGFTLLELLVALAIFSVIAVMAYGGLSTVLNQRALTEERAERLGMLQKTYLVLQRDLEQAVPRAIRDEFGDRIGPLTGTPSFQFTRGGWRNPLDHPRSTLQRVGYLLEDGELTRYAWPVLDRAQDSEPVEQVLAADITDLQVRYLDEQNRWQEQWPKEQRGGNPEEPPAELPKAIELSLEHEYFGTLVWLFQLP